MKSVLLWVAVAYLCVLIAIQHDALAVVGILLLAGTITAFILVMRRLGRQWLPILLAAGIAVGAVYGWFMWVGYRHWVADTLCLVGGCAVAAFLTRWRYRKIRQSGFAAPTVGLALLVSWGLVSMFEGIRGAATPPLAVNTGRFAGAERVFPQLKVGIALSGGGYRAALFHAGVLDGLERKGVYVENLSTVSGGSIIGAYYALGGSPLKFVSAVSEGRFNLKRRLALLPNALRLACPARIETFDLNLLPFCEFDRLDAQVRLLDHVLLGGAGFAPADARLPELLINMSDLSVGRGVGISRDFVLLNDPGESREVFRRHERVAVDEEYALAALVARSGAFPGAFPIRAMDIKFLFNKVDRTNLQHISQAMGRDPAQVDGLIELAHTELLLADGGIIENRGLQQLMHMAFTVHNPEGPRRVRNPLPCPYQTSEFMDVDAGKHAFDLGMATGPEWALDVALSSDASKVHESKDQLSGLKAVTRAVDIASSSTDRFWLEMFPFNGLPHVGITPAEHIRARQEEEATAPLSELFPNKASEHIFTYLVDHERLKDLVEVLPAHVRGSEKLAAMEQAPWQDLPPGVPLWFGQSDAPVASSLPGASPPSIIPEFRGTSIMPVPAWEKDVESFAQWLEKERCDNARWSELFEGYAGNCEGLVIATAVARDIAKSLQIFRNASTLRDVYSADESEAIYRLGRYMVALDWDVIEKALTDTCYAKPSCAQTLQ